MYTDQNQIKQIIYEQIESCGSFSQRRLISSFCAGGTRAKDVRAAIKELLAEGKIVKGDYLDHLGNKTDDLIVVEAD